MKGVDTIHPGDCVAGMGGLTGETVDLVFADPPFNIGYDYDVYHDRQEHEAYLDWSRRWIEGVNRVLKPNGTFWLAIGDDYAAELKLLSQEIGFHCRSWVVWYYTFGVNCTRKFSRSHTHLFHFVRDEKDFTFNSKAIRVPSARQLVYNDGRANPEGRLPDDTWILRPQDCTDGFRTDEDTWYFPRVAGTFKERAGFHGCQMPEQLLGRIIRVCSNPGETVLDPFAGSATSLAVAKKLGRRYIGFDVSEEYVERGLTRLNAINAGDTLEGAPEPLVSAPATPNSGRRQGQRAKGRTRQYVTPQKDSVGLPPAEVRRVVVESFRSVHDGYSVDFLISNPELNAAFIRECQRQIQECTPSAVNQELLRIRKSGKLEVPTTKRLHVPRSHMDKFIFGSEIATRTLQDDGFTLDDILCDPAIGERFDRICSALAPGFTSFHYRWAALRVRKAYRSNARKQQQLDGRTKRRNGKNIASLAGLEFQQVPQSPGAYRLIGPSQEDLYVGETDELRSRLEHQFQSTAVVGEYARRTGMDSTQWLAESRLQIFPGINVPLRDRFHSYLVQLRAPKLNFCLKNG